SNIIHSTDSPAETVDSSFSTLLSVYQYFALSYTQLQQYQPAAQQPLPYMSSPLEFQIPLGSYNATTPTGGAGPGPAQMGGPSPVEPSYANTSVSVPSRKPLLASDGISSPANPPDMSCWNPFGEDNFSKLTEEELLDREFDMLRAKKPEERSTGVEKDLLQPAAAKPLPPEDLFGSVPFVASAAPHPPTSPPEGSRNQSTKTLAPPPLHPGQDAPVNMAVSGNQEPRATRKSNSRPGEESDSDFESDPPSPKSSEDEEPEEEEGLNSEHGEDTEPENIGQRPLLMDSEEEGGEEDEDKHSSDSDCDPSRPRSRPKKAAALKAAPATGGSPCKDAAVTPLGPPEPNPAVDVFGAVPFLGGAAPAGPPEVPHHPSGWVQASQEPKAADEFDVFTKAPFHRNLSKPGRSADAPPGQTPPLSPEDTDIFGFSPFHAAPPPSTSRSAEDIFRTRREEASSPQQQRLKQRSLQKLSSRQRKAKQDAAAGGASNGKRHHGTPTGGRKTGKPSYRTPERARRHKKVGRRDSQSSNEFLSTSDSKENISVDITMAEGKDRGAPLPGDEAPVDAFGARPFHPQDGGRHGQYQGLPDGKSEAANGKSWGALGEGRIMDDFGAVPFTEMVVHDGQQPPAPLQASQLGELDPFGAAPFPSKQ
uniref:BMP-2-inducible protein kinase C-terminal domain-containing protein n=1 Tax=Tetraodon nigroviridis TaxID=99883 RepID=H3CMP1_TETNG